MDLELNGSKSIFKDFNDEEKCKLPLYNNFNSFIKNIEDMVKHYKKKDCQSLIYYYFLFYFIYHIGFVTKSKNIKILLYYLY